MRVYSLPWIAKLQSNANTSLKAYYSIQVPVAFALFSLIKKTFVSAQCQNSTKDNWALVEKRTVAIKLRPLK